LGEPTPDPNAISTAIAQTAAALTQTAGPGIPVTGDESPTPTLSPSPLPAATQTPSATSTALIILTPTSGVPQIRVSVPTNCRVGPGSVYPRVGALLVGEVAEVVGRHETRDYWVIRNPDRPGETCWLWGEYATLTGNINVAPVYTPPPTPTPSPTPTPAASFTASYNGIESCADTGWWVDIQQQNNGGINFQSIAMTVRDTVNNTVLSLYSDDFIDRTGCNETNTRDTLPSGEARIVSSPLFTYDPSGFALRATITLCSNPGQNGTCVTQTINFTP
jgi:hypothetical protein